MNDPRHFPTNDLHDCGNPAGRHLTGGSNQYVSRSRGVRGLLLALLLLLASARPAGAQWSSVAIDGLTADLYGADVVDPSTAWAVGWGIQEDYASFLKTTDGGAHWERRTRSNTFLFGVDFLDRDHGFLTGYDASCNCALLMSTTDGGGSWEQRLFPPEDEAASFGFYGALFLDARTGFLYGYNGAIVKTTDGGATWARTVTGLDTDVVRMFTMADRQVGYAASGGSFLQMDHLIKTIDGGETWQTLRDFQGTMSIAALTFLDPSTGFLAGNDGHAYIGRTTDGGVTWRKVFGGKQQSMIYAVTFFDSLDGYAIGSAGLLLRTTNAGVSWKVETSPVAADLLAIGAAPDGSAVAVGAGGTMLRRAATLAAVPAPDAAGEAGAELVTPNPFTTSAIVHVDRLPAGSYEIVLTDLLGREVARRAATQRAPVLLERGDLPAGRYFYRIEQGGRRVRSGMIGIY